LRVESGRMRDESGVSRGWLALPLESSPPEELIVFRVRANPHPFDAIRNQVAQGAVVKSHPHRETVAASVELLEMQRRMGLVFAPTPVGLPRVFLHRRGQLVVATPKPRSGVRPHLELFGHSRSDPVRRSAAPSSNRKSSLPALASASICLSHSSARNSSSHCATCRASVADSLAMSVSICSTLLICQPYAKALPHSSPFQYAFAAQVRRRRASSETVNAEP